MPTHHRADSLVPDDVTGVRTRAGGPWSRPTRWIHVLLLLGVAVFSGTTLANAGFTGQAIAPAQISTYDIPASTSITGTYSCDSRRTMTVNITAFGRVDRATGYTLSLAEPGTSPATTVQNLTASQTTTTITRSTSRAGNFTLNLTARVGAWTSDAPLTRILTCP
ncbi:hypothetical protein PTW37_16490 (plasmid) [Arthrobacter agilis]|uniref:hypothetical protein n=1 Tax=Arthrobacter agilis TaxID=37921 RepID=UPI0023653D00|nr:hypothetical protein [Arthrobacter agilis]WDF35100.1 hypothetical protein PTW37_16490 [Arthrobacter agilis]